MKQLEDSKTVDMFSLSTKEKPKGKAVKFSPREDLVAEEISKHIKYTKGFVHYATVHGGKNRTEYKNKRTGQIILEPRMIELCDQHLLKTINNIKEILK